MYRVCDSTVCHKLMCDTVQLIQYNYHKKYPEPLVRILIVMTVFYFESHIWIPDI